VTELVNLHRKSVAAFTVSESVQDYIARQEEHHREKSYREEVLEFLLKSGVEFDERYLD
jgi:REP-associated tyrosine transposase